MDREWLAELFAPLGEISFKHFFGGTGLYNQGQIFGFELEDQIYLKTDAASKSVFEEVGALPFSYEKNGKVYSISYLTLPDEALDDPDRLRYWARLGFQAALRIQAEKMAKAAAKGKKDKAPPPEALANEAHIAAPSAKTPPRGAVKIYSPFDI